MIVGVPFAAVHVGFEHDGGQSRGIVFTLPTEIGFLLSLEPAQSFVDRQIGVCRGRIGQGGPGCLGGGRRRSGGIRQDKRPADAGQSNDRAQNQGTDGFHDVLLRLQVRAGKRINGPSNGIPPLGPCRRRRKYCTNVRPAASNGTSEVGRRQRRRSGRAIQLGRASCNFTPHGACSGGEG
jgi:hypothetical protein